nr:centrosomal protein CCDC61-like [Equus asinus]
MKLARSSPLLPIPRPFAWFPDLCPLLSRSPSPVSITCRLLHLSPSPSGSLFSPDTPLARSVTPHAFSLLRPRDLRQQQRNRLGSGGSGDGPSISWSRQTRAPAAVSGRGDAATRSRNRSSSVDSVRSRGSSASSCSELEDFSESLPRGAGRRGKPPSPTTWSGSSRQQKATPLERGRHQRRLAHWGAGSPSKTPAPTTRRPTWPR